MSLCKDPYPAKRVSGCGHTMTALAWAAWMVATQDGSWTDYYILHEDKAREAAS